MSLENPESSVDKVQAAFELKHGPNYVRMLKFNVPIQFMTQHVHDVEKKLGWGNPDDETAKLKRAKNVPEALEILEAYQPRVERIKAWVLENTESYRKIKYRELESRSNNCYVRLMDRCQYYSVTALTAWSHVSYLREDYKTKLGKYFVSFEKRNWEPLKLGESSDKKETEETVGPDKEGEAVTETSAQEGDAKFEGSNKEKSKRKAAEIEGEPSLKARGSKRSNKNP